MSGTIYADLRCLQDINYRARGIGHHITALLRTRTHSAFSDWKIVGLLDPDWPTLPPEYTSLLNDVTYSVNPCAPTSPAIFLDGTPMTHDPRFGLRFQNHPAFFRAAVVYDFIPLDWPGYLPAIAQRIDYLAKLARLKSFDLFFPISEYTAWRLSELLGVHRRRICVTGASVRGSIYEIRGRLGAAASPYEIREPYFVIVVGPDVRKNPEVAVKAVRRLNLIYGHRIPLKVVGHYHDWQKPGLLQLAGHAEGAGFVEFCPSVPDQELVSLLTGAAASIVPSHIEGFSLPIVEAAVCGCPVIASTCAAHLELIDRPEALFQSDDAAALAQKLEALLNDPALGSSLAASQEHLGSKFHQEAVGRRFWSGMEAALHEPRSIVSLPKTRTRQLAFLSPYPPDQSGVARFTAMTIRAGEKLFDSDLYTDAVRPLTFEGKFRDAGGVSVAPMFNGRYDAVISVLGNSPYHTRIFEFFERYGGPCILHDARLTHIYFHRLGQDRFRAFAARLLGRSVTAEEIGDWLHDRNLPGLFLESIVQRASPLIVHTVTQKAQIKKLFGVDCHVANCCPTIFFGVEELREPVRQAVRQRLGIADGAFVISSFGIVDPVKARDTCIVAVELLRSWNIPAELHFVGQAGPQKAAIDRMSTLFGIAEHVRSFDDFVPDETYRDFLVASDAAVQLRRYGFGQFSAALADCVSAGLPSVANSDLAESCDSPPYVSIVPDQFSPLQVAEQLALIWERQNGRASLEDVRVAYLETHNYTNYAHRLLEILGIQ